MNGLFQKLFESRTLLFLEPRVLLCLGGLIFVCKLIIFPLPDTEFLQVKHQFMFLVFSAPFYLIAKKCHGYQYQYTLSIVILFTRSTVHVDKLLQEFDRKNLHPCA